MPFVETYAVNLVQGNLLPHVNLRQWPALTASPQVAGETECIPDGTGVTLRIIRSPGATTPRTNSLYLSLPSGQVPLDSRLHMRAEFDLPTATAWAEGADQPQPEPWAVVLTVSLDGGLAAGDHMVNVTCQFNRIFNGVRLNTPGALQTDKASCLESPLNYSSYQGGYTVLPNGREFHSEPPVFALEASFCGWNTAVRQHAVGSGALRIVRSWMEDRADHRVFSTDALNAVLPSTTLVTAAAPVSIRGLGVQVVTVNGVGVMQARIRAFSLSLNHSIA